MKAVLLVLTCAFCIAQCLRVPPVSEEDAKHTPEPVNRGSTAATTEAYDRTESHKRLCLKKCTNIDKDKHLGEYILTFCRENCGIYLKPFGHTNDLPSSVVKEINRKCDEQCKVTKQGKVTKRTCTRTCVDE